MNPPSREDPKRVISSRGMGADIILDFFKINGFEVMHDFSAVCKLMVTS